MERKGITVVKREIERLEKHIRFYMSSKIKDSGKKKQSFMNYDSAIAEARQRQGVWITTLTKMQKLK